VVLISVAFGITLGRQCRRSSAPEMAVGDTAEERSMGDAVLPAVDAGHTELPIRYTLPGRRIGVPSVGQYLRTLAETALWLVIAPLPARLLARTGARRALARAQRSWARGVGRALGLRLECEGVDRIDPCETYLVAPLHEGFADALAPLRQFVPRHEAERQREPEQRQRVREALVARDELAEWRLLGGYLRDTGQIIIRPEDGARAYRQMARAAREAFAAGDSVVVFPQGGILGIETDFQRGAFALARALGRPILPVALTGSHRVWEHPYGPRLRRGERVSLRVLPPIPAAEVRARGADELRHEVQRRLKAAALDGRMAPPRRFVPARDGYWDGYAYEIDPAFPNLAAEIAAHRAAQAGT